MTTELMEMMMIAKETERSSPSAPAAMASMSRKEKRKAAKKEKRKQMRKEEAEKERQEEEALLNDPEEQRRYQLEEEKEKERLERERKEFEERERLFLEELALRKAREEKEKEEDRRREEEQKLNEQQVGPDVEANDDEEWEYVEDGPPEIIWQGNEIIVKKNRVRVKKKSTNQQLIKEDENRPISNPLPPQSEAFTDHKNASTMLSAQQLLENVAQQTPNFGTEQDKAHCPFHLKTGACRFGARCSRVHFYPDKSCTFLIKNMYNGPGLAWEQDEGLETVTEDPCKLMEVPGSGLAWVGVQRFSFYLEMFFSLHTWQELLPMRVDRQLVYTREFNTMPLIIRGFHDVAVSGHYIHLILKWEKYTEEEVEHSFEEFYEDVHTEFLKFGELVNFKVCRNGSYHLRGNVYVHYKSLESAMHAYHSINGRYFAGKQVNCEFVAVTRWKVAICGEYMKSDLKTCSRGSACNFIHCFRNPGGDYEWADWDKSPPRYWVEKMTALFGYSDQSEYDIQIRKETPGQFWESSKRLTRDKERYRYRRSKSKEIERLNRSSNDPYEEDDFQRTKIRHTSGDKRRVEVLDRRESREEAHSRHHRRPSKKRSYDSESDTDLFDRDRDADNLRSSTRIHARYHRKDLYDSHEMHSSGSRDDTVLDAALLNRIKERHGQEEHREKSSGQQEMSGVVDNSEHKKRSDSTDSSKGQSYEDRDLASINDHWHRTYDFDSTSEWSDGVTERCHEYRRKSSKTSTEVSRISDDYTESHKISSNNCPGRESKQVNSKLCPVQKPSSSSRRDRISRKNFEVVFLDKHKRSDEEHVQRKSSQSDRISESYDSDFSYGSSKMGSVKPNKDFSKKSKRKFDYDHADEENHGDDTGLYLDEDVDRRGRWESEQIDSEKRHKCRRKSCSQDDKHHIGSGSWDKTSDEYLKESRSRSSSKSSNRKHKTNSKEMNSDAELKESGQDGRISERKYRSHGSKRQEKKTSS